MFGFGVESRGRKGGLALFWRKSVSVIIQSFSNSHIDATVQRTDSPFTWRLTGFYGEPEVTKRKLTWNLLSKLSSQSKRPCLCYGDFNELLDNTEKEGGVQRPNWQIRDFRQTLDTSGLQDLEFLGECFTWCNRQDHPNTTREKIG
ncbi:UNVERIFIED_CONTAM: hypothetical protein Sradi_2047500 [Sesamum radiatum]|uniref:Endonuclease/exonuclease/phosphatase domain-containing protein n=1 Tax=Sesamum radiatum TaxID=300843 RepID=A0AAW2THL5_SESRA